MKTFRMILIDPEAQTITEHQVSAAIKDMAAMIGTTDVDTARIAAFDNGSFDYILVDDTGLKRGEPIHAFQWIGGSPDPVAGKCLVYGATNKGETCDAQFPLSSLTGVVRWLGKVVPKVEWTTKGNVDSATVTWTKVN